MPLAPYKQPTKGKQTVQESAGYDNPKHPSFNMYQVSTFNGDTWLITDVLASMIESTKRNHLKQIGQ